MTDASVTLPVAIADIRRAEAAIAGAVAHTPTIRAAALSEMAGCEVFLKLETLHATGAFKERGALNKLLSLTEAERRAGVVAMSAGNHAQGVAYHARRLGIPATIVMPAGNPVTQIHPPQPRVPPHLPTCAPPPLPRPPPPPPAP